MKTKTCGECRHFREEDFKEMCLWKDQSREACADFEPPTKGDKIRQGGNYALAQFKHEHPCDVCTYAAPIDAAPACLRPDGKNCFDGMLAWLNAPAEGEESEGENESK
jgi:hypothetical protein